MNLQVSSPRPSCSVLRLIHADKCLPDLSAPEERAVVKNFGTYTYVCTYTYTHMYAHILRTRAGACTDVRMNAGLHVRMHVCKQLRTQACLFDCWRYLIVVLCLFAFLFGCVTGGLINCLFG